MIRCHIESELIRRKSLGTGLDTLANILGKDLVPNELIIARKTGIQLNGVFRALQPNRALIVQTLSGDKQTDWLAIEGIGHRFSINRRANR